MPIYTYKGIKSDGSKVEGTLEAASKSLLINILREQNIFVEDVKGVSEKKYKNFFSFSFSFGIKRFIPDIFFQLSTLLKSGITLAEALKIVGNQSSNKRLKKVMLDIASKVSEGTKFSSVLMNYSNLFDEIHINIIRASEDIGRLAESLENISRFEEDRKKNLDKIKTAMIYPLIVLCVGFGVVGFLLSYVVPKMQSVFASVKQELPMSTKVLISAGNIMRSHGILVVIFIIVVTFLIRYFLKRNNKLRYKIDKWFTRFDLLNNISLYRFTETMSFLLMEGVVLVQAISTASNAITNRYYKEILQQIAEDVKSGKSFSDSIKEYEEFPELLVAAIRTGERSGNLQTIFSRLSEFYIKKVEKISNIFLATIEPLFILFLGLVVGFIVISIMSPLFELNQLVK
jgi:type II secretory pathway component PulF